MNQVISAGSINMDIITRVERFPVPGETIAGHCVEYLPGGKGLNQAVACAKMGAKTALLGRIGNDTFGTELLGFIKKHDIETTYLQSSSRPSGIAVVTVDAQGQNSIIVVPGGNNDINAEDTAAVKISAGDIAVSQLEIPLEAVTAFFRKAKNCGAVTLLNPSPIRNLPDELINLTDILIVNETELSFLCRRPLTDNTSPQEIAEAGQNIKSRTGQTVITTLGSRGALIVEQNTYLIPGQKVTAVDTVGAGDCFAGVTAAQLAQGKSLKESIITATHAAAVCVTRKGAAPSMPHAHEVNIFCKNQNKA